MCLCQESIKWIIREEAVDWWLPVSHTTTAVTDTAVKTELEAEAAVVKVLAPDTVRVTEMLDDKIAFLEEARALNLPVPDYYQISSCQDVVHLCRQNIFSGRHFFLKPSTPTLRIGSASIEFLTMKPNYRPFWKNIKTKSAKVLCVKICSGLQKF